MPRGGARVGAGRKPKSAAKHALDGTKSEARASSYFQVGATLPKVEEFDAPNELTVLERNVWMRLAPGAMAARTLTKAQEYAFVLLCKNVVLEEELRVDVERRAGADHRGMIRAVEVGLAAFGLRAMGKPVELLAGEQEKPKSALEKLQAQGAGLRVVK